PCRQPAGCSPWPETWRCGRVSFDPNIRTDLWQSTSQLRECLHRALMLADVAKVSEEELFFISGEQDVRKGTDVLASHYPLAL
ncbi:hypothetical protein ACUOA8_58055, partial [Escherichia sp. SS-MK2]